MILNKSFTLRNRKQAAFLLAEKLMHLKNSSAVIVGIPYSGAVVGYYLAESLNLPFDVVACSSIRHPADHRKTIGSVSIDNVIIHDDAYEIPRDYIYHQIIMNQNALRQKQTFYHGGIESALTIKNSNVIVVGDIVKSADALIATVRTLRSQQPATLCVAACQISPEAIQQLACEVDEIISLSIDTDIRPELVYEENEIVRDEDIRDLLQQSAFA